MRKVFFLITIALSFLVFVKPVSAQSLPPGFITVVNPIRGSDFWDLANQKPADSVREEMQILKNYSTPATWLVRFDALGDQNITSLLKSDSTSELGLFLEVTPSWTLASGVTYHKSSVWHDAASVFLTGYSDSDRQKLIDSSFEKFKSIFGYYPKSVGAWWIDAYSLEYMQSKYGVTSDLIVSDQYSTDNYQIWGQYFSTPYYPAKRNALIPAQSIDQKIGPLTLQWAPRDPVNSYGKGVEESTYSTQPNDYIDYHNLDSNYFSKLIDTYLMQKYNKFNQLVVGLENSYSWQKYGAEYQRQIQVLNQKRTAGELQFMTMSSFSSWYGQNFTISPPQLIISDNPVGGFSKTLWYMNPYYRIGWFYDSFGSSFRDIRPYVAGSSEICFDVVCDSLNFASTATRSLDDVTFNQRYTLDQGSISDFTVSTNGGNVNFSYKNEAGSTRNVVLLPRDISIDSNVTSIDTTILHAQTLPQASQGNLLKSNHSEALMFQESPGELIFGLIKSVIFLLLGILIPGFVISYRITQEESKITKLFISSCIGLASFTLISYLLGYIKMYPLVAVYIVLLDIVYFLRFRIEFRFPQILKEDFITLGVLLGGTVFQTIPTFKSGFIYDFGMGFWGPNAHDGVWHLALINQLKNGLPVQNPILSDTVLKNYHYLFDLMLAAISIVTKISASDLLFRFIPPILSVLSGIGIYLLVLKLTKNKLAANISLYLSFFCGSFGWIVDYIHNKSLNGESAFWANQSISFNLNPPYAISQILLIGILLIFLIRKNNWISTTLLVILCGSLFGFKSYGGILILGSLFLYGTYRLIKLKEPRFMIIGVLSALLTLIIFLPNFTPGQSFFTIDPLWLVNSIIDSPDRVGWARLSSARIAYLARGQWPKYIVVEIIGLLIFILGNLGMRFFGLWGILKSKTKLSSDYGFLMVFTILALIIPLIFIQSGTPWNIIQFFYYFMFVVTIFSGIAVLGLFYNLPKALKVFVITTLLVVAPINSIVVAKGYLQYSPHTFISLNEYSALGFLSKQPLGVVLTYPFDSKIKNSIADPRPLFVYDSTSYVGAFSNKIVYVEDESQNDILGTSYQVRLVKSNDFFRNGTRDFLTSNNIKYIYVPKYFNLRLDEQKLGIKNIFNNDEIIIYELI